MEKSFLSPVEGRKECGISELEWVWLEITIWVWSWHHYLLLNYAPSLIFSHPFFFLMIRANNVSQLNLPVRNFCPILFFFFFFWLPQFKTEKQLPFGCEGSSFWIHLCPGQALAFWVLGLTKSLDATHSGREGSHRFVVIRYPIGNIYEVFIFTYFFFWLQKIWLSLA